MATLVRDFIRREKLKLLEVRGKLVGWIAWKSNVIHDLDFGEKWFRHPCSEEYWREVKPVFDRLSELHDKGVRWSELTQEDKWDNVYVPLLIAFMNEIKSRAKQYYDLPRNMVEYLVGQYDFYKVISVDVRSITKFQTFNVRGTLNRRSADREPDVKVPLAKLPSRILYFDFKEGSKTTLEMCMNEGWQFTFRIHNGDGQVIPSLKFDVQIKGMPEEIRIIDVAWLD